MLRVHPFGRERIRADVVPVCSPAGLRVVHIDENAETRVPGVSMCMKGTTNERKSKGYTIALWQGWKRTF